MILAELLDRAELAAGGVANAPESQPDREVTAYVLYPHAVRAVYREQAKTGRHLDNLTSEYEIEVLDGVGDLPDEIFREYLDRSFMTAYQFASLVPFEDYGRYRFDNQMTYFAARGKKFLCSKEPGQLSSESIAATLTVNSQIVTFTNGAFSVNDDGKRMRIETAAAGVIFDMFIEHVEDVDTVYFDGFAPFSNTGTVTVTLFNQNLYLPNRTLTLVTVQNQGRGLECATGAFTSADVGRRCKVVADAGNGAVLVDAIIASVESPTEITLWGKSSEFDDGAVAYISYSPHLLQAVGIPDLPTDVCDALELAPEVAEDVIMKIASVLRGEVSMQKLIEVGSGK